MEAFSKKALTALYVENYNGLAWLGLAWLGLARALRIYYALELNIS